LPQRRCRLPPDNFQETPSVGLANRTSPTNMGMALLANLAALDFGYISAKTLIERTAGTFSLMEELPRHHGHFCNWYDTGSLEPLPPRYVSTADSGNLAGALVTLQAGLAEMADRPIVPDLWCQGLEDTSRVLLEELQRLSDNEPEADDEAGLTRLQKAVTQQIQDLASVPATLSDTFAALSAFAAAPVDRGDLRSFFKAVPQVFGVDRVGRHARVPRRRLTGPEGESVLGLRAFRRVRCGSRFAAGQADRQEQDPCGQA